MSSTDSMQGSSVQITAGRVESGDRSWPLDRVSEVEVREASDFTLVFLQLLGAAILIAGGIGLGLLQDSLGWGLVAAVPGLALVAMALHRGLGGDPLFALVLHWGVREEVVWCSSSRARVAEIAERVRSACL